MESCIWRRTFPCRGNSSCQAPEAREHRWQIPLGMLLWSPPQPREQTFVPVLLTEPRQPLGPSEPFQTSDRGRGGAGTEVICYHCLGL